MKNPQQTPTPKVVDHMFKRSVAKGSVWSFIAAAGRQGFGFIVFVAASIAWIGSSAIEGEAPLAIQNVVLLVINLFGVYRYLIRKKAPA